MENPFDLQSVFKRKGKRIYLLCLKVPSASEVITIKIQLIYH